LLQYASRPNVSLRRLLLAPIVLVLALAGASRAAHADPATLTLDRPWVESPGHVDVLLDKDRALAIDEISGVDESRWQRSTDPNPNLGFTKAAVWIRFRLDNPGDATSRRLFFRYPLIDNIDIYVAQPDGTFTRATAGDRVRFSERPFDTHLQMFELDAPARSSQMVYLRIVSDSSMQIAFDVATPEAQQHEESNWLFIRGGYYGLMLALALYNFFLFLSIRTRAYFWYVVYVVVFTGTQMALDGTAGRYLFPELPDVANTFTPLTLALLLFPPVRFAQYFLETDRYLPRFHTWMTRFVILGACAPAFAILAPYAIAIRVVTALAMVTCIMCLAVGAIVWRRGYRAARYYVVAWSTLLVGTVLYMAMAYGFLPANAFFANIQRIGSVLEVTLLSFALGDHISTINAERDSARHAALELERDLAVTGTVQKLFLPRQETFASESLALRGFYAPAAQSGGDWWWYEDCGDGRIRVLLGDVTGHGVGAAMVTAGVAATYRSLSDTARHGEVRPVIDALNGSIAGICAGAHHMTLGAFEIDTVAGKLRMWSAGAPAALVIRRDGTTDTISARGSALGATSPSIGEASIDIGPGDRIFVFSDGLHERALKEGRQLGYRGVRRLLEELRGRDLDEAHAFVTTRLRELAAQTPPLDDIAFVLIDVIDRAQAEQAA
jgi:serine phosphatase RsbU (regulator of sigma subunit)